MHLDCVNEYIKTHYTCPVCKKSLLSPDELENYIHFGKVIEETPMPLEYKDVKMTILCNDCLTKSEVPFHILGGKCL